MKRSFITVLVTLVFTSITYAQDAMQKRVDSLGSTLGAAVGQERRVSGGGRVREFEKGAIFWTRKTGARFVGGSALEKYKELGGESGALGYPVGDESATKDGLRQTFEHGFITTSRTGDVEATILPGATLTESALTVATASPVVLSVDLDDGFLVFRTEKGPPVLLSCACEQRQPDPGSGSQRAGICAVEIKDKGQGASCKPLDNSCGGPCEFEVVSK